MANQACYGIKPWYSLCLQIPNYLSVLAHQHSYGLLHHHRFPMFLDFPELLMIRIYVVDIS